MMAAQALPTQKKNKAAEKNIFRKSFTTASYVDLYKQVGAGILGAPHKDCQFFTDQKFASLGKIQYNSWLAFLF